jgi:hypothetical protein
MSDLSKESRLRILDTRLFKKEKVNYKSFLEHLEREYKLKIDERTFERDIKSLRERLADRYDDDDIKILYRDREHESYKYLNGYFAFEETSFVKGTKLGKLLKYNKNFITDIDKSVRNQIDALVKEYIDTEEIQIQWQPVQYVNIKNSGQENFPALLNHIISKTPLIISHGNIKYKNKDKDKKTAVPLLLKELDNGFTKGWYLLAQKFDKNDVSITLDIKKLSLFALDRIGHIEIFKPYLKINNTTDFDPNDYFNYTFKGTSRQNIKYLDYGPVKVKLKICSDWILPYLKDYPIHTSQKIIETKNDVFIELLIEIGLDLQKFLVTHSDSLLVISPEELKDKVIGLLKDGGKVYGLK